MVPSNLSAILGFLVEASVAATHALSLCLSLSSTCCLADELTTSGKDGLVGGRDHEAVQNPENGDADAEGPRLPRRGCRGQLDEGAVQEQVRREHEEGGPHHQQD